MTKINYFIEKYLPVKRSKKFLIFVCLFQLIYISTKLIKGFASGHLFWDLKVYQEAAKVIELGLSPYKVKVGELFYFYPPVASIFLPFFFKISEYTIPFLNFIFIILLSCWCGQESKLKNKKLAFIFFFLLLLAPLKSWGIKSFITGNISFTLYLFTIIPILFWRKELTTKKEINVEKIFTLTLILIASFFKPYFLVYLTIYLFNKNNSTRFLFALGLLIYTSITLSPPFGQQISHWLGAMKGHTQNFSNDIGKAFLSTIFRTFNISFFSERILSLGSSLINLTLLLLFLVKSKITKKSIWVYLILCLGANPRVKIYDLFLLPLYMTMHYLPDINTKSSRNTFLIVMITLRSVVIWQISAITLPVTYLLKKYRK